MKKPRKPTTERPQQFDFARNWKRLVARHLDDPMVQSALNWGMQLYCNQLNSELRDSKPYHRWVPGNCPARLGWWRIGRRIIYSDRKLSWYQPRGCCHWIAPFVFMLARRMFPKGAWIIYEGMNHTVVTNNERSIVFDILSFREFTARESLLFAGDEPRNATELRFVMRKEHEQRLSGLREQHRLMQCERDRIKFMEKEKLKAAN